MVNSSPPWTPEEQEICRRMWTDGKSYGEIGNVVGRTRSAVAGVVRRLKLPIRGSAHALAMRIEKNARKPKSLPKSKKFRFSTSPRGSKERTPPVLQRVAIAPDSVPVCLTERSGCCYPVTVEGPHLFCNAAVGENQSYCEFHLNVMYPKRRAA